MSDLMIAKLSQIFIILAICASASVGPEIYAESSSPREYMIKVGFLYNFAKFVEWPDEALQDSGAPMVIGILGEDPFSDALKSVKSKAVKGRPLAIRHITSIDEAKECHILFIRASEKERLKQILGLLKDWNVLTVSDMQGFAESGGIIMLYEEDNKIRFAINLEASRRAGLKISSKLLNLAKIVEAPHHPEGK